jgi:hypothetical protein
MKNNVEEILETVVWIVNQLGSENLDEEPVLELAKTLSAANTGPHRSRIVPQEENLL